MDPDEMLGDFGADDSAPGDANEEAAEIAEDTETPADPAADVDAIVDEAEEPAEEGAETAEEDPEAPGAEPPAELDLSEYAVTVKVDGEEREVSIPDLVQGYQTAQAAQAQFRKAAEERRAAKEELGKAHGLVEAAKADPTKFLTHVGVNPLKWAVKIVQEAQAFQKMTPEQRQLHLDQRRIAEERAQLDGDRKRIEDEKSQKQVREERYNFVSSFLDHLDEIGYTQAEKDRKVLLGVVDGMRKQAKEDGVEMPLHFVVKQAIERLTTSRKTSAQAYLESLSDAELLEVLGPERAKKFRAAEARKAAATKPAPKAAPKKRGPSRLEVADLEDLIGS